MAPDGFGSDDIEVDGVMSRPSNPMPYERKCSGVLAPIAFSVRKSFWKKFLGNGVRSVRSVVFIKKFSLHFLTFITLHRPRSPPRVAFLVLLRLPVEKHYRRIRL